MQQKYIRLGVIAVRRRVEVVCGLSGPISSSKDRASFYLVICGGM
jgi:hypothetical protein